MTRIKPKAGKTVRLAPGAAPMLQTLRESMEQTTTVGGVRVKPLARISDAAVLGWALAVACAVANPRLLVIDRVAFVNRLDAAVVKRLAALGDATPEQRHAQLELLVAGSCDVSPYDMTAPLRAVPPEGKPS